ncbi:50S ribosomal protein L35 [Roseibacillus persicicus]|uniref:Large ribosomal subunit protein bL35 n=2 Tax=Roseibacillus persicicus TaxID=454148 RepID=A0A918TR50_9BACT|nr:50S ribosomal protein L35 [Roseibacillus persicicus]GHC59497.1 hypothetical protein GCM10007100_28360 [Roseibacillus persicicus]
MTTVFPAFRKKESPAENPLDLPQEIPSFRRPMARTSGKAKTRKAVAKRFKVTGSGKILRRKQGKRHILTKKSRKRKRSLGKAVLADETNLKAIRENLPFGKR